VTLRVGVGATPFTAKGIEFVREAERLGVDSVWVPEFWVTR
jgi:alkanesulfonate monooxygenase SsuD/methylene tetrahydromethanopterin reductase-like flavin-dependent oxidoreductase (luciferase family)